MYLTTFLPRVALFFLAASSAVDATSKDTLAVHQIIARSNNLSLRQDSGYYPACNSVCVPLDSKVPACGYSDACACSSGLSTTFHDCVECSYKHADSASIKAELLDAYNEYLDGCKEYGYPIQGDTSIAGAPTVERSSSSSASASASATAAASFSTASTKSASNGANVLSSGLVSGVALPLAAIAVSALVL